MVKVQTRGLGKGLAALIAEPASEASQQRATAPSGAPSSDRELPLTAIVPSKYQPRQRFSEEDLRELSDSIARNGVMQPIVVRPQQDGNTYEIVAGERRWRASSLAGLTTIPAIIRTLTDQQVLEIALIENIQRADLTPLEEAQGYQRLLSEFNYTIEALAKTVGKSRSHISNLLRLLNLPNAIRNMLESGQLTMGHARALLSLPEEDAVRIAQDIVKKDLSVRQVEALARGEGAQTKTTSKPKSPSKQPHNGPKDDDIVALETTLSENLGMPVTIQSSGEGGELTISYTNLAQLDDLMRRLGGGF